VRNVPANVRIALRAVAELKRVAETEVARATTANAVRLFGEGILRRCG
jgi:Tat protein secretion system quality control protein TatD with DNase activity